MTPSPKDASKNPVPPQGGSGTSKPIAQDAAFGAGRVQGIIEGLAIAEKMVANAKKTSRDPLLMAVVVSRIKERREGIEKRAMEYVRKVHAEKAEEENGETP